MRCTACTVNGRPWSLDTRTRGLAAGASDAHETVTSEQGSSPQVRWICSGVPSGTAAAARVPARPLAVARPDTPASFRKPRRVTGAYSYESA